MPSEFEETGSQTAAVADILRGELGESPEEKATDDAPAGDGSGEALSLEQELAAILGETQESPDGGDDTSPGGNAETRKTVALGDLTSLAESLGVESSDLYSMAVPMPDGDESVSLGELKDMAIEYRRSELDRQEWEQEQVTGRAALADAREEIATLFRMIPEQMRTPQMLAQARQQLAGVRDEQARSLLTRVPSWKDETAKEADMAAMREHLEPFGFGSDELSGVYDARLLAYVRHNALREQRLTAALAKMRKRTSPAQETTQKRRSNKRQTSVTGGSSRDQQTIAVGAILSEIK